MMTGYKLALGFGGAAILLALLAPLALFTAEAVEHPDILTIKLEETPRGPVLVVDYKGSVPLYDFKVYAGNTVITVGAIHRGETRKPLTPPQALALEKNGVTGVHYSIAGLYTVQQQQSRESRGAGP